MPKKPTTRWETELHHAIRDDASVPRHGQDTRAECFDLVFEDGHRGRAEFCLDEQRIDAESFAKDPELVVATQAWLIARGQRQLHLRTMDGQKLAQGAVEPADLDQPGEMNATQGLISLAPSNYDLAEVFGLCDERLLACEDSTTPGAGCSPEKLGPDLNPDLDRAQALRPALVLASLTVPGMERVVLGLRRRQLPYIVFAPRRLDDIEQDIRRLSQAVGISGEQQLEEFRALRASLARGAEQLRRPVRVFLEWWPRPQFSPGAHCYSNELIALAGGVNIFADQEGSSLEVSPAQVAERGPELAFVSWCGVALEKLDPSRMAQHEELRDLEMLREGRVYPLDEALSGRPGPRVLRAAQVMAEQILAYAEKTGLLQASE